MVIEECSMNYWDSVNHNILTRGLNYQNGNVKSIKQLNDEEFEAYVLGNTTYYVKINIKILICHTVIVHMLREKLYVSI